MLPDSDHPIWCLTMMLFNCSSLLDTGKFDDLSIEEVKEHIRTGDLIQFLNDRARAKGESFDNGVFETRPEFAKWYLEKAQDLCENVNERRKFGVESRGLCLLIVYTAEIIQRGDQIRMR